jgi:hypothetical protein
MCYLIAKNVNKQGCIALQERLGNHLAEYVQGLESKIGYEKIQLVTISRPSAYGEYEPYSFAESEEEFTRRVLDMNKQ